MCDEQTEKISLLQAWFGSVCIKNTNNKNINNHNNTHNIMKTNLCSHKVDQIAVMQLRGYLGRGGKRKAEDSWSCSQRQYRPIASSFSKSFL